MYKFSKASLAKLSGVNNDLIRLMNEAIIDSPKDFGITEGIRSKKRQYQLYNEGKSKTLNSKHLTGRAVDILVYTEGKPNWGRSVYEDVINHIKATALRLNIKIKCGWDYTTLNDPYHIELV